MSVCHGPNARHMANMICLQCVLVCRVFPHLAHSEHVQMAVCISLPSVFCLGTRQIHSLPCAFILPCVFGQTLGKTVVCRVPVLMHTAKVLAHGKRSVSGSVRNSSICSVSHTNEYATNNPETTLLMLELVQVILLACQVVSLFTIGTTKPSK